MAQSLVRNWLHVVFSTKMRAPLIELEIEKRIHRVLWDSLTETGCVPLIINGMPDHVHMLFLLNHKKSLAEVMQLIKGGSSHAINSQDWMTTKFTWQKGYGAFSVSESRVVNVKSYIKKQKQKHATMDYVEEFKSLVVNHGMVWVDDLE